VRWDERVLVAPPPATRKPVIPALVAGIHPTAGETLEENWIPAMNAGMTFVHFTMG